MGYFSVDGTVRAQTGTENEAASQRKEASGVRGQGAFTLITEPMERQWKTCLPTTNTSWAFLPTH